MILILEGYLNLFPRVLSCYPDDDARRGRSCQVDLLPTVDAPRGSVEIEREYYTTFIDEGSVPNEALAQGYGFGSPLKVFTSDGTQLDPYDRVRLTGTFNVASRISSDGLMCTLDVREVALAEEAGFSWANE